MMECEIYTIHIYIRGRRRFVDVIMMMMIRIFEAVLVHDPVGLLAVGSSAAVEDEGFPHPDLLEGVADAFVSAGCFPESCMSGSVCPRPCWIFSILVAEKVPFILWG